MSGKIFLLNTTMFLIYFFSIILLIIPPFNKGDAFYIQKKDLKNNSIYCMEYKNRYYFYNYADEVVMVNDIIVPGIPRVQFSNDKVHELELLKNNINLSGIILLNFQKSEIICYNKIRIKFYEYRDLVNLFGKGDFLSNLNPGEYTIINNKIIKE